MGEEVMKALLILLGLMLIMLPVFSKEIVKVGLEVFPPLIIDANKGYTIDILKEIEKNSDLGFQVVIMPYSRARTEIASGASQLIGHTPYKLESKDFYAYAQEINLQIETKTDLYVMNEKKFENYKNLKIGIPRGNEIFASDLLGIPVENFYVGELESLLKMLEAGRIDAFWFERSSTMKTIEKLKIKNVYYENIPSESIFAGLAVQKNAFGNDLRQKMETSLQKINLKVILKELDRYNKMPAKGIIK